MTRNKKRQEMQMCREPQEGNNPTPPGIQTEPPASEPRLCTARCPRTRSGPFLIAGVHIVRAARPLLRHGEWCEMPPASAFLVAAKTLLL